MPRFSHVIPGRPTAAWLQGAIRTQVAAFAADTNVKKVTYNLF